MKNGDSAPEASAVGFKCKGRFSSVILLAEDSRQWLPCGECFCWVIVSAISAQLTSAQQSKELAISEPGVYELSDLFKQADTVALVSIVSGDTESYSTAVYKAEVVTSFKRCCCWQDRLLRPLRWRATRVGVHSVPA
jgi:hypothetical protein